MVPIADDAERYRLEMLEHLQREYQKAQEEKTRAEQKAAELRKAVERAKLKPPCDDSCPRCFYHDGIDSRVRPVPSPQQTKFDRWKCERCGHTVMERVSR